jgi:hypothetical protein
MVTHDDVFGIKETFWKKVKRWGNTFSKSKQTPARVVKGLGLVFIGIPLAASWGVFLLLLRSAVYLIGSVILGSLETLTKLCKAVYNAVAVAVNTLKGDIVAASRNKSQLALNLSEVLSAVVQAVSLGFLCLEIKDVNVKKDDSEPDLYLDIPKGRGSIGLDYVSPLIEEAAEIGQQVSRLYHQARGGKEPRPKYEGHFTRLTDVISRIRVEAGLVNRIKPSQGATYAIRPINQFQK